MTSGESGQAISEDEINQFSQKLETWGQGLTARERGLLQLLLTRASEGEDVQGYSFGAGIGTAATQALLPAANSFLIAPGIGPEQSLIRGWVQMGDPWIQYQR